MLSIQKKLHFNKPASREGVFFCFVILLHLVPVFLHNPFPTLDGPAHLYNSKLLLELLASHNTSLSSFLHLNASLYPNWLSHALLTGLQTVFPVFVTQKIIVCIYIILLPLSFRYFLLKISSQNKLLHYAIFPFLYSFLFYCGFYNFCLSLALYFFALGFWMEWKKSPGLISGIGLSLFLIMLYFAHVTAYLLWGLTIGIFILFNDSGIFSRTTAKNLFHLFLISLPSLVLTLLYLSSSSNPEGITYLPLKEHIYWLKTLRPLILFDFAKELKYLLPLNAMFLLTFIFILISNFKKSLLPTCKQPLFIVAALILMLFFFLPNSLSDGGYVTDRTCLFFYLMLLCWFCTRPLPKILVVLFLIISLSTSVTMIVYHHKAITQIETDSKEFIEAGQYIPANSTLLPINLSDNFMHGHLSNYLGCTSPNIVVLENYEASRNYFPIIWNDDIGKILIETQLTLNPTQEKVLLFEQRTHKTVDFISLWNPKGPENPNIHSKNLLFLNENYTKINTTPSGKLSLYKRN